jgi:PadR family transcriptional regulator AphA
LADWLDRPGAMPSLEFEALVKVFFAEHGTTAQLLATLQRVRQSAARRRSVDARWAAHYLATGGRFPERLPVIILVGKLQAELNRTLSSWAEWACDAVAGWPADPRAAPADLGALEEIAGDLDGDDVSLPPPGYEDAGN